MDVAHLVTGKWGKQSSGERKERAFGVQQLGGSEFDGKLMLGGYDAENCGVLFVETVYIRWTKGSVDVQPALPAFSFTFAFFGETAAIAAKIALLPQGQIGMPAVH